MRLNAMIVLATFFALAIVSGCLGEADPLSTHILDTALGKPAGNVEVCLYKQHGNGSWVHLSTQ